MQLCTLKHRHLETEQHSRQSFSKCLCGKRREIYVRCSGFHKTICVRRARARAPVADGRRRYMEMDNERPSGNDKRYLYL